MSDPTYYCESCGMAENVLRHQYGRGFPPDKAKRALTKRHRSQAKCANFKPTYRVGIQPRGTPTGQ